MKNLKNMLFKNNSGLAMVEFAFVAPILLVIVFGCSELFRYVIIMQKVERTAYAINGIIDQSTQAQITKKNIKNDVFPQVERVMAEYYDSKDIRTAISSVTNVSTTTTPDIRINWQIASNGKNGSLSTPETISIVSGSDVDTIDSIPKGTPAAFKIGTTIDVNPKLTTMMTNENMIVVEVFYQYSPALDGILSRLGLSMLPQQLMVSRVYSRPRQGDLLNLPNN